MDLIEIGLTENIKKFFHALHRNEHIIGRVNFHSGRNYKVLTEQGEISAILSKEFEKIIDNAAENPTVGDWVGLQKNAELSINYIISQYPRTNRLSRKAAGNKTEEQVIASNVDIVFIISSVDQDFNLRRIERYVTLVYDINAVPIIILNKIDTVEDAQWYEGQISERFPAIQIVAISAIKGSNLSHVEAFIQPGKTIVLLGSSGVGKSTLINKLLGYDRLKTGDIRKSDGKGRHITTNRELIVLPKGGILIDNPGLREIQLWTSEEGISKTFSDIEDYAIKCRFDDCTHDHEPGCAVKNAVKDGKIAADQLYNYHKLRREQQHIKQKKNIYAHRKKDKKLAKMYRQGKNIRRSKGKF